MVLEITRADADGFRRSIKKVADTWETPVHEYSAAPGSEAAYDEMGTVLRERMEQQADLTDRFRNSGATLGGFAVTSRFIYAGARKAAQQSLDVEQLRMGMYAPGSFRQLQLLTRERNPAATQIEFETGLRNITYSHVGDHLDDFMFDPHSGLTIRAYSIHRLRARSRLLEEGRISEDEAYSPAPDHDPIRCLGHAAGLLAYTYKYMLDISCRDQNLFSATLAAHTSPQDAHAREISAPLL